MILPGQQKVGNGGIPVFSNYKLIKYNFNIDNHFLKILNFINITL